MRISKIFKKTGLTLAFALAAGAVGDVALHQAFSTKQKLTEEQVDKIKAYFGDQVDTDKIHVSDSPFSILQKRDAYMVIGNTIYSPATADNGTGGIDGLGTGSLLIHETTHIWQNQNKIQNTGITGAIDAAIKYKTYGEAYAYDIDTTKLLTDYNLEQQGDIVADLYTIINSLDAINAAGDARQWDYTWPEIKDIQERIIRATDLAQIASSHLPVAVPDYFPALMEKTKAADDRMQMFQQKADLAPEVASIAKLTRAHHMKEPMTGLNLLVHATKKDGLVFRSLAYTAARNSNITVAVEDSTGREVYRAVISEYETTVSRYRAGDWEKRIGTAAKSACTATPPAAPGK